MYIRLGHISEVEISILSKYQLLGGNKIGKLKFYEHYVYGKQESTLCLLNHIHQYTSNLFAYLI